MIVVIALLALVLVFIGANVRALDNLGRELRLVERQQKHRLEARFAAHPNQTTNSNQNASTPSIPQ